jgi:hypothetical protein
MLPTFLRESLTVAVIKALVKPLDDLHADFLSYLKSEDISVYSQVCYMQGLLNDVFDPLERRIRINQAVLDKQAYLYWLEITNKPVLIYKEGTESFVPRMESKDGQIGLINNDFEIILPVGFTLSENEEIQMKSIVNRCKLASKRYIITNG